MLGVVQDKLICDEEITVGVRAGLAGTVGLDPSAYDRIDKIIRLAIAKILEASFSKIRKLNTLALFTYFNCTKKLSDR